MNNAPVIIPTLCRYEHFKNCIDSLRENDLAVDTELYIGIDYPTKEAHRDGYNKIKDYVRKIDGFKQVHAYFHGKNLGSLANTNFLLNEAGKNHENFIFSEDDNVFSKYFLHFINKHLTDIKDNDEIIGVCGYGYPFLSQFGVITLSQSVAFSAWGYGMWFKDRAVIGNYIEQGLLLKKMQSGEIRKKVNNKSPFNYELLMSACRAYPPDTCWEYFNFTDFAVSSYMLIEGKKIIMPSKTLVRNCGWDNSGEHCSEDDQREKRQVLQYDYPNQPMCSENENPTGGIVDLDSEMVHMWKLYTLEKGISIRFIKHKIREQLFLLCGQKNYYKVKKFLHSFHKKK